MFNFGINWQEYSDQALDEVRFNRAVEDLEELVGKKKIKGKFFLDIGCGSGIHSLAADKLGAKKVVGVDISAESVQSAKQNKKRFAPNSKVSFSQESIFEMDPKKCGTFDIVYSWGVLHHTGEMKQALKDATVLVDKEGLLVVAIYNKHWSSRLWWYIKKLYNLSPKWIQQVMVIKFSLIIALAKFVVTGNNPFAKKRRGMTFYYDVIDWLGGFPYEYASKNEVVELVQPLGFKLKKFVSSAVPTGCHEYVFVKK